MENKKMAKNNTTVDRIQAVWNLLGGEEGVEKLLNHRIKLIEVDAEGKVVGAKFRIDKIAHLFHLENLHNQKIFSVGPDNLIWFE